MVGKTPPAGRRLRAALTGLAVLLAGTAAVAGERGPWTATVMFENDLFGDSDSQYTNGLKLSLISPDLLSLRGSSWVPGFLLDAVQRLNAFERSLDEPGEASDRQYNLGVGIGQMMFTPEDTQASGLVIDDRPYAGWLYGTLTFVAKTRRVADTLELQLGVVGPESLAEDAQRFVHDIRDLPVPRGWDNQLETEPAFVIFYERKWHYVYDTALPGISYDVIPHAGVALGTVATYLALGGEARVGWNLPEDFGTSLIRPGGDATAPSLANAVSVRARPLGVYAFTAIGTRLVGRDIFLDGNTFTDSHDVSRELLVGDLVVGASVVWGAAKLSYAQVFRTREFDHQNRRHKFGSITFSLAF